MANEKEFKEAKQAVLWVLGDLQAEVSTMDDLETAKVEDMGRLCMTIAGLMLVMKPFAEAIQTMLRYRATQMVEAQKVAIGKAVLERLGTPWAAAGKKEKAN